MYFEDEKENMRNGGAFDDLDVDIDGDDKSVTWDDLLNDDADIDLSNAKKGDAFDDDSLLDSSDDDMSLLNDDMADEVPPAPRPRASRTAAPRKDAFDVFGGRASDVSDNMNAYEHAGSRSAGGDTFTPDLTNRQSARAKARMNDDDDIYFEPRNARKSSSALPKVLGLLVACVLVGAFVYVFITYGKPIAGIDANQLFNQNKNVQETPLISDEGNKPAIDINAPAEQNAANNPEDKTEAKKEEQKFVTFSVSNGGRINPFTPPSGFESTKFAVSSDYEILTPPEEIPGAETADEAKQLMDITVSGILFDNVKPSAIINVNGSEYFVQIGDKVDDFQVVAINSQYVAIKNGSNTYKAQVGETFTNAAGKVPGMAKRQASGKFAGSRQYTSTSDVEVSVRD